MGVFNTVSKSPFLAKPTQRCQGTGGLDRASASLAPTFVSNQARSQSTGDHFPIQECPLLTAIIAKAQRYQHDQLLAHALFFDP